MNENKKWKIIPNTDGKYAVSDCGEVKNLKPHYEKNPYIINPNQGKDGYLQVSIIINGARRTYTVHRLVALMFIPNPMFYKEVNHKDGNKANNCVDNLEWCTRSQNMTHAFAMGLKKNKTGADSCHAKKCYEYDMKGNFIREWGSMVEAAEYYNDVTGNVCAACSGKYKTFHNHIWSYEKLDNIDVNAHRNARGETTYQYTKDKKLIAVHFNMDDAVEASGVDKSNITKCCLGKRKTAGGYIWSHTPLEEVN
ncbi:MAG: HNH endonuclease [Bacilli bacterium]|nr:HNH endonuclease [Bacilli bacterium]